jgi:hypothetical protein
MLDRGVLVSVVITNYNYERYLREAILSVLGQTYSNIETIVVDDGSTDGSRAIIEEYRDRLIVLLQENRGPTGAYNAGYAASHGELIAFLDADDVLRRNAVQEVVAAWQPAVAKVQFGLEIVDAFGQSAGAVEPVYPRDYTPNKIGQEFAETSSYIWPPASGNAFSRRFLAQVMPLSPERFRFIDGALNTVAPLFGEIQTLAEPLGFYRIHANNLWALHRFSETRIRAYLTQRQSEFEYLRELAPEHGVTLSAGDPLDHSLTFLRYRLIAAKLGDRAARPADLLRLCLIAGRCLGRSEMSTARRAVELLWFVLVSVSFGGVARRLIEWRFDRSTRPTWIGWLFERYRVRASRGRQAPAQRA